MLVSIIIPVYNVQDYLEECIESVLIQNYANLEIILIDDGSTDKSGEICDLYSKKDTRIKVIHKENGGVSSARNAGISIANGEYLYFLDSDDVISENSISAMLNACNVTGADIVVGAVKEFKKEIPFDYTEKKELECYNTEEVLKKMLMNNEISHSPWGKLYSKELWKEIRFPEGVPCGEDYACIYYVMAKTKKIILCNSAKYYYRIRQGSAMRSSIKNESLVLLDISDKVTKDLINSEFNIKSEAIRLNMVTYLKFLKNILNGGFDNFPQVQKRIIRHLKSNSKYFLGIKEVRFIDKIKLLSLYLGRYVFYIVYSLGERFNDIKN